MHGARNIGGGEYSIYLLIKNLRRDIFDVLVFYSHENDIIKRLREEGVKLINIPLNKKITSVYRDEIKKNPVSLFNYVRYLIAGILAVVRALKKNKVDILHPHDNLSKIIGGIAAKIAGVKVVAHCHDILKGNLIERILIVYQLLFMDRIIAVSEDVKDLFKIGEKVPRKVKTIYNGIDLEKFDYKLKSTFRDETGIRNGNVVIGIIAVFDKCKGHIYLFQAIERLVSEGRDNIVCLVIGDGRIKCELKGFVFDRKLEKHILFLGYRNDIPMLIKSVDIIVTPSLQESFGMVPLEAMAMKVPVIATKIGGLVEVIEDGKTGILVPPMDVSSLCSAIKYLIENPKVRKKMGEAGRKRVEENFSIETNVRKTEELYLELVGN